MPDVLLGKWPKDRFDLVVALQYNNMTGQVILSGGDAVQFTSTNILPQMLLQGDRPVVSVFKKLK